LGKKPKLPLRGASNFLCDLSPILLGCDNKGER